MLARGVGGDWQTQRAAAVVWWKTCIVVSTQALSALASQKMTLCIASSYLFLTYFVNWQGKKCVLCLHAIVSQSKAGECFWHHYNFAVKSGVMSSRHQSDMPTNSY